MTENGAKYCTYIPFTVCGVDLKINYIMLQSFHLKAYLTLNKHFLLHTIFCFKGIVSRDGVSTEIIGVQFRPKQPIAYLSYT
jgi:hypothetical protein